MSRSEPRSKASELLGQLQTYFLNLDDLGYADGLAGAASVYAYAADIDLVEPDIADMLLARLCKGAETQPMYRSLFSGSLGVAWAVIACQRRRQGSSPPRHTNELDDSLYKSLLARKWTHQFDLIDGLTGAAIYCIERAPVPVALENLGLIARYCAEMATRTEDGARWSSPPWSSRRPGGCVDCGVAHGAMGPLFVLAYASAAGVGNNEIAETLGLGLKWLRSLARHDELSVYPGRLTLAGDPLNPNARTAWCYGDPGIAAVLDLIAELTDDAALKVEAQDLLRTVATRIPSPAIGIRDGGFCHGAAGVYHLLAQRMTCANQGEDRDSPPLSWYRGLLALESPAQAEGSFPSYTQGKYVRDPTLLTGALGVAASLMTGAREAWWNRPLLASMRPIQEVVR